MAARSPGQQHGEEHMVEMGKDCFTHYGRVVASPADNHRRQGFDENRLFREFPAIHHYPQLLHLPLDGRFCRFDDRLESEWLSLLLSAVSFPHCVLPNVEAEEVKAR